MRNEKGVVGYVVLSILVLIGLWFIIASYKDGTLMKNLQKIYTDYKSYVVSLWKDIKQTHQSEQQQNQ